MKYPKPNIRATDFVPYNHSRPNVVNNDTSKLLKLGVNVNNGLKWNNGVVWWNYSIIFHQIGCTKWYRVDSKNVCGCGWFYFVQPLDEVKLSKFNCNFLSVWIAAPTRVPFTGNDWADCISWRSWDPSVCAARCRTCKCHLLYSCLLGEQQNGSINSSRRLVTSLD